MRLLVFAVVWASISVLLGGGCGGRSPEQGVPTTTGMSPIAMISASKMSGAIPLRVVFDASESYDTDGYIARYEWDWNGDGLLDEGSTDQSVTQHEFVDAAQYNVYLYVTDNSGNTATASVLIIAEVPPLSAPHAILTASPKSGTAPLDVYFNAQGSNDDDGQLVTCKWDWEGDGEWDFEGGFPEDAEVTHTYTVKGTYNPAVLVTDNTDLTAREEASISVTYAREIDERVLGHWNLHFLNGNTHFEWPEQPMSMEIERDGDSHIYMLAIFPPEILSIAGDPGRLYVESGIGFRSEVQSEEHRYSLSFGDWTADDDIQEWVCVMDIYTASELTGGEYEARYLGFIDNSEYTGILFDN